MKVLRLSNSNDEYHLIPPELRAPVIAARRVEELTGQQVETETRYIWPSRSLADRAQAWVEEAQPDVVLMRTSSFWVNFESVPLKVQRRLGRVGRPVARVGLKAGENPRLAHNAAFRTARMWAVRAVGGVTYFTPADATALTMAAVRRIAQNESLIVAVRGPHHSHNPGHTRGGRRRAELLRLEFEALLRRECEQLRIPFAGARDEHEEDHLLADDVHDNIGGHQYNGELDGQLIADAWNAAHKS